MTRRCWTPLGPACTLVKRSEGEVLSGLFLALAADSADATGRTVYAAAAAGGIWKSTDEGITWTPVGDALPRVAVGVLAAGQWPDGTPVLVAGTGDSREDTGLPGVGAATSTSDGASWETHDLLPALDLTLDPPRITAAAIDTLTQEIWVATDGRLFSRKRGGDWSPAGDTQGHPIGGGWNSVVVSSDRVLAGHGGTGGPQSLDGIYATARDGSDPKTLVRLTGGPDAFPAVATRSRVILAVAPSNEAVVYAAFISLGGFLEEFFRSPDGGATWFRRTPPFIVPDAPERPLFLVVHPNDPDRIYLGSSDLKTSADGGATAAGWKVVDGFTGPPLALAFSGVQPFHAWLATKQGLYFSAVEGSPPAPPQWQRRNRGLATVELQGLAQHPAERSILLGASADLGALRYRGHPLWERMRDAPVPSFRVVIDPNEPTTWYATSDFRKGSEVNAVHQSKDGGKTWRPINSGVHFLDEADVCPLAVDPSQKGIVYLGTESLYRWDDAHPELGWVEIAHIAPVVTDAGTTKAAMTAIAVALSDPNLIYVGTKSGDVFRVVFNAQAAIWELSSPLRPPNIKVGDGISSLAVSPRNPQLVYATIGYPLLANRTNRRNNFKVEHRLFRSDDGGSQWTSEFVLEPNERVFFHKILFHPDDDERLFLATDRGVLATRIPSTGGHVWTGDLTANLPRAPVSDILIFPPGPADPNAGTPPVRLLRAATFGRGAWERVLGESESMFEAPESDCTGSDVYLRDNLLDTGDAPTPETQADPLPPGKKLNATDAVDLRIDRRDGLGDFATFKGNRDYLPEDDPAAVPDFIGFELFRGNDVHENEDTHVYLQVHNRGPSPARVKARVLYGRRPAEPLPSDPFGAIASSAGWQPVGDTQEVDVPPANPAVVSWSAWHSPDDLEDRIQMVGIAAAAGEVLVLPSGAVATIAPANKSVILRSFKIHHGGWFRWWMVPVAVGIVGGLALGIAYRDDIKKFLAKLLGFDSKDSGS